MGHVTVLTAGNGGARFLAGLIDAQPEECVHVLVNVGADFETSGLYCCPDIDLVLHALAGESDPYRTTGDSAETYGCLRAIRKLGMPAPVPVSDREFATHLMRTELLKNGSTLEAATERLARRFGVGPLLLPLTNDRVRTVVETARGPLPLAEYRAQTGERDGALSIRHDGAENARPLDRAVESILQADRIVLAPADPGWGIGALLAMAEVRHALARTRASVVAISPLIGSQPARGGNGSPPSDTSVGQFAASLHGVVDSVVIHTTDLPRLEDVRAGGVDAWVDNILINTREDARRLAARVLFAERMVARKR